MDSRIVITGATGAIGNALIHYALEQKIEVLAICHRNSARIARLPDTENVRIIELNADEYSDFILRDEELRPLGKYDCFFHLAWQGTIGAARDDMYLQLQNVEYTLAAVDLASKLGCKCFIGGGHRRSMEG